MKAFVGWASRSGVAAIPPSGLDGAPTRAREGASR
jgi:hypothetical protein